MAFQIVPIQIPLTNGVVRSFGHVRLQMAGMDFSGGFKSIKRSRKRNREMVRSNNVDPIGKTLGENEYQCSAVVYVDTFYNFIQTVNNNLGPGYAEVPTVLGILFVCRG